MTEYTRAHERHLIEAINAGDEHALKLVYLHFYEKLCIYILNFSADRDLAEDVVQDTFLKLWNSRHNLRSDGALSAYLYKITYNNFIDNYRKTKQLDEELENIRLVTLTELLDDANEDLFNQRLDKVKKAIEQLPPRCKEIFLMNKEKGMRYKEIAKALDLSVKTVENQIGKALQLLRANTNLTLIGLLMVLSLLYHQSSEMESLFQYSITEPHEKAMH